MGCPGLSPPDRTKRIARSLIEEISKLGLEPDLEADLRRVAKEVGDDPYVGPSTLGIFDVLKAHYLIAQFFYLEGEGMAVVGPRDLNLLHSAMFRQHSGFGDFTKYTTPIEIAGTLMFGLVMDHPFVDANKRTAFLSVLYYLYERGYTPVVDYKAVEDFLVDVADGRLNKYREYKTLHRAGEEDPEITIISRKLNSFMRKVDKRFYTVTYRELDTLLRRFNCWMDDPSGNYINVYKQTRRKRLLRSGYNQEVTRVMKVGFPGWTKQVNVKAMKSVLKRCKLDADHGIDSQSFFHGLDPMNTLIAEFQEPLKRLAYR